MTPSCPLLPHVHVMVTLSESGWRLDGTVMSDSLLFRCGQTRLLISLSCCSCSSRCYVYVPLHERSRTRDQLAHSMSRTRVRLRSQPKYVYVHDHAMCTHRHVLNVTVMREPAAVTLFADWPPCSVVHTDPCPPAPP